MVNLVNILPKFSNGRMMARLVDYCHDHKSGGGRRIKSKLSIELDRLIEMRNAVSKVWW